MIFFSFLIINTVCSQEKEVKIAMTQIFCLDGDRSGNFVRIENAIMGAKEMGTDIVCFPETSLFGWVNPDAHNRANHIPGPDSDKLCIMAINHNIFISIGLAEKDRDVVLVNVELSRKAVLFEDPRIEDSGLKR